MKLRAACFPLVGLVALCPFFLFPACTQTPTPTVDAVKLTLIADAGTTPLLEELVSAYQRSRPNVTLQLENSPNTGRVLEALGAEGWDLAAVSWLSEDVQSAGIFWHRPFARDAIVLVTHHTNYLAGLTLAQLRDIYQGQTLAWSALGGPELDVIPVSREEGAGTRLAFEALVMGKRSVTPTSVVMPTEEAVVEYVATTPGAIGYVSTAWLAPVVNLLALEGVTPSPEAVQDGRYLLSRSFYLMARSEPAGDLAAFVEWVAGEGQEIVKRAYAPAP